MQNNLKRVESLKKILNEISPLKSEDQKRLDKKFRLEFSYNSNHIEGNTLTYGETELLILYDDTKGNHTLREFEEMKSHDIAFLKINDWAKEDRELTETDIKELNKIILVRDFWKEAITYDNQPTRRKISVGSYKQYPNSVRLENGEMFEYASVTDTPIQMRELMDWYKTEAKDFHPVVLAALFHYKFVRIHPFDDGNGRVARLLLNYILLRHKYPPVVIKSNDKKNYLSSLHKADLGDLETFFKYVLEQQIWSLELSIKAAKGQNIDEPNDWEKKLTQMKTGVFSDKNKKIDIKLNDEVFDKILEKSLNPLVHEIDNVLIKFEVLFDNNFYHVYNQGLRIKNSNLKTAYFKFIDNHHLGTDFIGFNYQFINCITIKSFHTSTEFLKIRFNENNYKIILVEGEEIMKFYNEYLDEDEIKTYSNLIASNLMRKIEEAQNQQTQ